MKTLSNKTRTKIEDLTEVQGSEAPKQLSNNQLRLVTGGLRSLEASSCTMSCDVDCD